MSASRQASRLVKAFVTLALASFAAAQPASAQLVDLNTATVDTLTALVAKRGYTDRGKTPNLSYCKQVANKIVASRPYSAVLDLSTRKIVSATVFGYIRTGITVGTSGGNTGGGVTLPFPKTIDLSARQSPVRNQAHRNTCIPFSVTAGVEAWDRTLDLSEQLLYYLLREQDADRAKCLKIFWDPATPNICDDKCSGATLEDAVKVLQKIGLYTESAWPYDRSDNQTGRVSCHESATWASKAISVQGKKTVKLGPVVWLAGPGETPKSKRVDDPMVVMAIIAKGFPVNIAIDVAGSGWGSGRRIDVELDPIKKKPLKPEGGHGLLLVGYDYDQKVFKFKNSWDSDWGESGYGYLTFDYLKTYAYGGYYVTSIKK